MSWMLLFPFMQFFFAFFFFSSGLSLSFKLYLGIQKSDHECLPMALLALLPWSHEMFLGAHLENFLSHRKYSLVPPDVHCLITVALYSLYKLIVDYDKKTN